VPTQVPTLLIGSDVENLQRAIGMKVLDGVYGADTVGAVKTWQTANKIEATGFFGKGWCVGNVHQRYFLQSRLKKHIQSKTPVRSM
jgi:peptidoglycan hydrolase-like protein with peptidoglycan-binding domain